MPRNIEILRSVNPEHSALPRSKAQYPADLAEHPNPLISFFVNSRAEIFDSVLKAFILILLFQTASYLHIL